MRQRIFITALLIFCAHPIYAVTEQQLSQVKEEIKILLNTRMEIINSIEGREHFGGPLKLEDYDFTVDPVTDNQFTFHYQYTKDTEFQLLDSFDVGVENLVTLKEISEKTPAMEEEYQVEGKFTGQEEKDLLSAFQAFCRADLSHECSDKRCYEADVAMPYEGVLKIERRSIYSPCCFYRMDDDTAMVTFDYEQSWEFKRTEIDTVLGDKKFYGEYSKIPNPLEKGQHLLFEKKLWAWTPVFFVNYDESLVKTAFSKKTQNIQPLKQGVEITGKISSEELKTLLNICHATGVFTEPVRLIQIKDDYALTSGGGCLSKVPQASVVFRLDNGTWKARKYFSAYNIDLSGIAEEYLPLLPKPSEKEIKKITAGIAIPKNMNRKDVEDICCLVLRLKDIDKAILCIEPSESEKNIVKVMTGKIFGPLAGGGSFIELKKVKGVWIIKSIGMWVS